MTIVVLFAVALDVETGMISISSLQLTRVGYVV